MSVNENDQPNLAPSSGNYQTEQRQQAPAGQQARPTKPVMGARTLNQLMQRPFSRSSISEDLQKVTKVFQEFIDNEISATYPDFKIMSLDKNNIHTAASAIVLVFPKSVNGRDAVTFYTLVIEDAEMRLNNRITHIQNQPYETVTTIGDVCDRELMNRVMSAVQDTLHPNFQKNCFPAGINTIYSEADKNDKAVLRRIFQLGISACWQAMVQAGYQPETVFNSQVLDKSDILTARVDFNPHPRVNSSGLPIRGDVGVNLQVELAQSSQSMTNQIVPLTELFGYIDMVYEPVANQYGGFQQPMMNVGPGATRRYTPRFVITDFASCLDASTMELQLLAMASAVVLNEPMGGMPPWVNTFKSRPSVKGEVDYHDIGAVGYEVNLGNQNTRALIDTKSNDFGTNQLYGLIDATFFPNMIYSIDVEENGDMSFLNMDMVHAAVGNFSSKSIIYSAANALTNDVFGKIYSNTDPMFNNDDNRIFTGYFINQRGEKEDLRKVDYLFILNKFGEKNPSFIKDWSDTFEQTNIPAEIRLDRRRKILETIFPGNVHIKGYARRITMHPSFLAALVKACTESGLLIQPRNLAIDNQSFGQHGIANAHQIFGLPVGRSGLFSMGATNTGYQGNSFGLPVFNGMGQHHR